MPSTTVSQEQLSAWVKEQFQRANKHLAEKGVLFDTVVTEESRYLAPFVAIWKIKALDGQYFWVISGDVPADFMPYKSEKNPRDALRGFSFRWQLQADNILNSGTNDKTQHDFADRLIAKAEAVYELFSNDKAWA
ncbi:MAG: hypothetical protein ACI936_003385 [Paraglaciecola sp.]|jgi:hypothetical protein